MTDLSALTRLVGTAREPSLADLELIRRTGQTTLSPVDEMRFQNWATSLPWYRQFTQKYGEVPNLNDPQYDYRRAYISGISPKPYEYDREMDHWPSTTDSGAHLKAQNHPTAWMNEFMQRTGIDPHAMGVTNAADAAAYVGTGRNYMRLNGLEQR